MVQNNYSKITPEIEKLSKICKSNTIDSELYTKFDVKRGLRDINGKGVLTGLTRISEINASKIVDGKSVPCDGELFYRGICHIAVSAIYWTGTQIPKAEKIFLNVFYGTPFTPEPESSFRIDQFCIDMAASGAGTLLRMSRMIRCFRDCRPRTVGMRNRIQETMLFVSAYAADTDLFPIAVAGNFDHGYPVTEFMNMR